MHLIPSLLLWSSPPPFSRSVLTDNENIWEDYHYYLRNENLRSRKVSKDTKWKPAITNNCNLKDMRSEHFCDEKKKGKEEGLSTAKWKTEALLYTGIKCRKWFIYPLSICTMAIKVPNRLIFRQILHCSKVKIIRTDVLI